MLNFINTVTSSSCNADFHPFMEYFEDKNAHDI